MPTSVHATPDERRRPLPGDELIPAAIGSLTHAVTIARPPADVWPWLAQMGADRAGWYSYDRLDNGGRPSAWRIEPALQAPATGDVFPALPGRKDGFKLVAQDPGRSLVLSWPTPDGGGHAVTWSFVLDPVDTSRTRLVVRARGGAGYRFHGLPEWLSLAAVRPVHFVMERKQLIGIARRAEREPGAGSLLDRFVANYDIVERHQIQVKAPPDVTFAAACQVNFQRSPIIHTIVRGREWMMGSRAEDRLAPRGLLAETKAMGWGVLDERPRAIVMGAVTKPWEPNVTFHALAPDAFARFAEPGFVKIAWTLEAHPDGGGSIARTETRAVATDAASRATFRRYWRRVWPGIVVIRWVALRLMKRDAERQARRRAAPGQA